MSVDEHIIKYCNAMSKLHYGRNVPSNAQKEVANHTTNIPEVCVKTLTEFQKKIFSTPDFTQFWLFWGAPRPSRLFYLALFLDFFELCGSMLRLCRFKMFENIVHYLEAT